MHALQTSLWNRFWTCNHLISIQMIFNCRIAFFTEEQVYGGRAKWLRSIKESLNNSSLICTANTTQILGYLMRKLEEYKENNMEHPPKEAVTVTGLQLCTSSMKVWVLNEHTHVDEHGQYIDPCQSPYIWLAKYLPQNEKTPFNIPAIKVCFNCIA